MDWSGFKEKLSAYAEVFRVTWPLALGMANNAVMQFVDRVFLARESTAALEAVLPASMLSLLFVGFAQTTVAYSGTFVAQYFGAGDRRGCRMSYFSGMALAAAFGAVLLLLAPVGNLVFEWVAHSPEVLIREKVYYSIVTAGGFVTCAMMAASGYFTGMGRTRMVFWVNLLGNALNIAFDPLLIFGCDFSRFGLDFSLPAMGMAGAAWATVAAQAVQALILNTIAMAEIKRERQTEMKSQPAVMPTGFASLTARILRFGIPSGVQSMLNILSFLIFVMLTGKVGDMAFAVSNAAFAVNYLLIAPMEGVAVAAGVLVGQHQGAGDSQGAFVAGNRALVISELYIAITSVLILVFHRPILMLFAGDTAGVDTEAFCSLGFSLFVMMVAWQFCDAADVVLSGALKGAGDTRFVMIWMMIVAFPVWMPPLFAVYFLCPTMEALWMTLIFEVFVFFVGTVIRWVKGPWRKIRLIA